MEFPKMICSRKKKFITHGLSRIQSNSDEGPFVMSIQVVGELHIYIIPYPAFLYSIIGLKSIPRLPSKFHYTPYKNEINQYFLVYILVGVLIR